MKQFIASMQQGEDSRQEVVEELSSKLAEALAAEQEARRQLHEVASYFEWTEQQHKLSKDMLRGSLEAARGEYSSAGERCASLELGREASQRETSSVREQWRQDAEHKRTCQSELEAELEWCRQYASETLKDLMQARSELAKSKTELTFSESE